MESKKFVKTMIIDLVSKEKTVLFYLLNQICFIYVVKSFSIKRIICFIVFVFRIFKLLILFFTFYSLIFKCQYLA